ncbi:hypothetical protein [Pseudoxanthomonas broegbernensis]|uniref:hypothetical protein n=1 Tax=Pseudoxanthomonas broegbernensis TaxID=83619 RepID=UPI001391B611|nr:hypothetical protein [Pseudoxanthomonas broegbernensis]MBB6064992.1 hypothetical protein [Pseudoxanthomonas broegbernensis]
MTQLPGALHDEAIGRIAGFSVGITGIDIRDNKEVAYQSGSGTLVNLDGALCIVTADHVIEDIMRRDRIGLLTDWHGGLRRCVFDRNHLRFVRLGRGDVVADGPDLGAILLPDSGEAIASLKSHKVFYDLGQRVARFSTGYLPLEEGVWMPCGVLGEGSHALPSTGGFDTVTGHWGMVGIAPAPDETLRDGFDYLELRGRPGVDPDMPGTFGGASGGGLWQARIARRADGSLALQEVILSGVIFYETAVKDGVRGLRCHGRASVHERLVSAIRHCLSGGPD